MKTSTFHFGDFRKKGLKIMLILFLVYGIIIIIFLIIALIRDDDGSLWKAMMGI